MLLQKSEFKIETVCVAILGEWIRLASGFAVMFPEDICNNEKFCRDFGRYRFVERLGIGSSGEVWEVRRGGCTLALKILHGICVGRGSLHKEASLLMGLSHPNIVKVHGVHASSEGRAFIEMEKADGKSLSDLADSMGGFLPWDFLKPLAIQLCDALAHAHENGVVHRDVKPSNLIASNRGLLTLVDFGCAALAAQFLIESTRTIEMASSGTLPFMSPQQINGALPDPADDLYAVGATLHSLVVGFPPFTSGHLVHQILNSRAPSVTAHQKQLGVLNRVPSGVVRIVSACLEKDASRRPASAAALKSMLEKETPADAGRRKVILGLTGFGLGLAVCGGISALRGRDEPSQEEAGFSSIFDGKTLDGWRGDRAFWKVQDGVIFGRLEAPRMADASNWRKEFLNWMGEVPDHFEIRLQVSLRLPEPDAGNLGVRYRIGRNSPSVAYDLDFEPIWKYNCGLREIGGRDMLARPTQMVRYRGDAMKKGAELLGHVTDEDELKSAYRHNAWNDLRIRAVKNRLIHQLNGITIVDCVDDDPDSRRLSGGVGLKMMLYYGPWVEARFRHIRVRAI